METLSYVWTCHRCKTPNQANADKCASCGFPAIASAKDIETVTGEPSFRFTKLGASVLSLLIFIPIFFVLKASSSKLPWWVIVLVVVAGLGVFALLEKVNKNDR
jgi:hypothetical protein